jgi:N-acetylglucosamine-6-phosphate deacetylase
MTGLGHRDPGLALAALLDDDVWTELIADRHHVDPALWPLIARLKPRGKVVLVSDALAMAGTDATTGTIGGQHVRVDAGRVALIGTDTIAGSVLALDTAVRHLVADGAGLPDAVMAASTAPARLLGLRDRGRLAPGLRADVVELDADLAPRRVMIAGASIGGVE